MIAQRQPMVRMTIRKDGSFTIYVGRNNKKIELSVQQARLFREIGGGLGSEDFGLTRSALIRRGLIEDDNRLTVLGKAAYEELMENRRTGVYFMMKNK